MHRRIPSGRPFCRRPAAARGRYGGAVCAGRAGTGKWRGPQPPMGWNSWNTFGCNINETLIRQSVPGHGTVVYLVSGGTSTPPPGATTLVSAASGRCLDVPNSSTINGTQPVIWDCKGGANQRWTISGQIIHALGKCLDAPPNATTGSKVQIWRPRTRGKGVSACTGKGSSRWVSPSS